MRASFCKRERVYKCRLLISDGLKYGHHETWHEYAATGRHSTAGHLIAIQRVTNMAEGSDTSATCFESSADVCYETSERL